MYNYTLVESDTAFREFLKGAKSSLALDFEGEFNLHIYGEHLCLIQIFDRTHYFLIDPFKVSAPLLKGFFSDKGIEKIMFDCSSDASLIRHQYGVQLEGVYDLRVGAQLLGYNGNLSGLITKFLHKEPEGGKRSKQTSNWLRRPLKRQLIEYALSDVEHLFDLKEALEKELERVGLGEKNRQGQVGVALPKGAKREGWEKINGYRYLSNKEKVFLKHFFLARDTLAQELNLPPFKVLDKQRLLGLAKRTPTSQGEFRSRIQQRNKGIEESLATLLFNNYNQALKEIEEGKF